MLKKRIIPVLLHNDDSLIKGQQFDPWRRIGSVLPAVRVFNQRDVDELILLNVKANQSHKGPDFETIREVAKDVHVPLSVGGGITCIEDVISLFNVGADKIVLNSVCYENPNLISEVASRFGSQAVVASVDVKRDGTNYICYSHSGTKVQNIHLEEHLQRLQNLGTGEIMLSVINDEGMMKGIDLDFYASMNKLINVPLIVSGGIGSPGQALDVFEKLDPSAIGVSSLFAFTETTPKELKLFLGSNGISIRK